MVLPKTHLSQRVELLLLVALRRRGLSLRRVMPRGCQMRVRGRRDARQHVQYAAERTRRGASLYVAAATGRVLLVGRADRARADSAPSPQPLPTAVDIPFWCPSHKRARRWRPQGPPPKEHSTQKVPLRSFQLPTPFTAAPSEPLPSACPCAHPFNRPRPSPAPPSRRNGRARTAPGHAARLERPPGGRARRTRSSCFLLFSTAFLPFPLPASLPSAAQRPPSHLAFTPRSRLGARRVPVVGAIAREGHRKLLAILDLLGRPASGVTAYNLGGGRATCAL